MNAPVQPLTAEAGERAAATFDFLDALLAAGAASALQADLIGLALARGRAEAAAEPLHALLQIPLAVYEGLAGDWQPALPLAAACHLLYLGADLLDNVADQELPEAWSVRGPDQAVLAGCGLLYPLAQQALACLTAPPKLQLALVRELAAAAWTMLAGQQADLLLPGRSAVTPEECLTVVAAKSGAEVAVCCRAAALLAGAPPARAEALAAFGRTFGVASQLASDCHDVWGKAISPDLANGRWTLPVVHAHWATPELQRPAFRRRLAEAGADRQRQQALRELLEQRGSHLYCALRVEVWRQEALQRLRQAEAAQHPVLAALMARLHPMAARSEQ